MNLTDAFGEEVRIGDEVAYAGRDYLGKPTINKGEIDALNISNREVRVERTERSGNHIADTTPRRVWVSVSKVCRINI